MSKFAPSSGVEVELGQRIVWLTETSNDPTMRKVLDISVYEPGDLQEWDGWLHVIVKIVSPYSPHNSICCKLANHKIVPAYYWNEHTKPLTMKEVVKRMNEWLDEKISDGTQ